MLFATSSHAQVNPIEQCAAGVDLNAIPKFPGTPTLTSGTALTQGAVYRYNNAVTSPYNMYALVTIDQVSHASVVLIDETDNADVDKDNRFQPQIKADVNTFNSNRNGYVQFTMKFYKTSDNTPANIAGLRFTHYDMDGHTSGTNGWFRETSAVNNQTGTIVSISPLTQLVDLGTVVESGISWKKYNGATVEHTAVSSDPEVAMVALYGATSSVTFRMGYDFKYGGTNEASAARQYAAKFGCFNFVAGGALPVKLSYFAVAAKSGNTAMANWTTEEEINHDYFELQRSFNANDFKTVAVILGPRSTTGSSNNYEYTDKSAELAGKTIVYYRLKQVDKDGAITYSSVRTVRFNGDVATDVQVSPNPFQENISLKFVSEESGTAEMRIINMSGQKLFFKQTIIVKGYNNLQADGLSKLSPGVYVVQLLMNGNVISKQKLVKN